MPDPFFDPQLCVAYPRVGKSTAKPPSRGPTRNSYLLVIEITLKIRSGFNRCIGACEFG